VRVNNRFFAITLLFYPFFLYTFPMKSPYPLWAFLFFAAFSAVSAQEDAGTLLQVSPAAAAPAGPGLFPLNFLLDAALSREVSWRPDWPAAIPPDSFTLLAGQAAALTLTLPADLLDADTGGTANTDPAAGTGSSKSAAVEYRLTRDRAGRLGEFPFFMGGTLYQAAAVYDSAYPERIKKITADTPDASDPWEVEFLKYDDGDPSQARIDRGGTRYFAALQYHGRIVTETWYDQDERILAFFSLEYQGGEKKKWLLSIDSRDDQGQRFETYRYDSAGNITALESSEPSAGAGEYMTTYNAKSRPRYWDYPGANYILQWDEQGFLVRLMEVPGSSEEVPAALQPPEEVQPVDIGYEYTLDERGNWTERRGTSLLRRFGRLAPGSEAVITRDIHYSVW
jgi:hypothetical protein